MSEVSKYNASVHNISNRKKLELIEKGVEIFELPTYSPQLNIAEILWRFIKYKWLSFFDYEFYYVLKSSLVCVLTNIGVKYTINFA